MTLIGLTQRISVAPDTGEKRDCLAQDWRRFCAALGFAWASLPNHPDDAVGLASRLSLGGLVLTGGDDLGLFPERDATEFALLDWAKARQAPVLGVCRGFQVMQAWLGGGLRACDPSLHRARRHAVRFSDGSRRTVNSYHNLAPRELQAPLHALAHCEADGLVEAASGGGLLGLLWHPEREAVPHAADLRLVYRHLAGREPGI